MSQHINLLQNRAKIVELQHRYAILRKVVYGYVALFFLMCIAASFYLFTLSSEQKMLDTQKTQLLQSMQGFQEQEAKLTLLGNKVNQFDTYIRDDAQFSPYYNILLEALQQSSESAQLSEFTIDKSREAKFTLKFKSFENMLASFRFIESQEFLEHFEELSMNNFSGQNDQQQQASVSAGLNDYQLTFDATFKPVSVYESK